jgi:MraZ protein
MSHWGRARNTLDEKGRVSLPPRFRDPGVDYYVLNRGLDGCLNLFTPQQYEKTLEKIQNLRLSDKALPITKRDIRWAMREWTKYATDVQLDKQNRILISKELLELAGLKKEVIFQGTDDLVEIWDPEIQEQYSQNYQQERARTFEDIAENFE